MSEVLSLFEISSVRTVRTAIVFVKILNKIVLDPVYARPQAYVDYKSSSNVQQVVFSDIHK